jgi:hypothetical protein
MIKTGKRRILLGRFGILTNMSPNPAQNSIKMVRTIMGWNFFGLSITCDPSHE